MRKLLRRLMLTLLAVAISVYFFLVALALYSDHLIFQAQPSSYSNDELTATLLLHHNPPGQVVQFASGDQKLTAVYLPKLGARYTLLFSHGNAEDIGNDLPFLEMYRDAGFSVFAYDYRGYGTSSGRPSEKGMYSDVTAAYDYLTRQLHTPGDRVISMGRSLGCAAAIELATRRPVAALIIEAPFLSAFRVLTHVQLLPWDKFRNVDKIKQVYAPVLVIHGRDDEVVPFWHGERLYELANQPKQFVAIEEAHHNDLIFVAGLRYLSTLQQFATTLPSR